MPFKIRNSIWLGAIFLFFTILGLVVTSYIQPRSLKAIAKQIAAVTKELEDLPGLTDEVQRLTAQFQDVKRRYDSRSKEIPTFDISSQTYGYMSEGIDEAGFLKFDMRYVGAEERGGWGYNAYKLEAGEAQFENLYKFVYFLENGRRLYKVANVRLDQKEAVDVETKETTKWIAFEMEIHAYYVRDVPELATSLAAKSLTMVAAPPDPFKPLVLQTLATEAPPGEINAERVEVKAVLPGKAFVLYENELIVLQLGTKVWRGYVSRINPAQSSVEFTLDEGGVIRTVEKKIAFEKRLNPR